MPDLTERDWMHIEAAAAGFIDGESAEWPSVVRALEKVRQRPLPIRFPMIWLRGFCEGVVEMRGRLNQNEGGTERDA